MCSALRKIVTGIVILFSLSLTVPPEKKIKVWLMGDSTMCLYDESRYPLTGWGMPFAHFFDSTVTVMNKARGGRSTRTFISENRWQAIADSLEAGDYVFIQFGHNDEAKEPRYAGRYTPVEDYKKNLVRFILEARIKSAIPVLITPVTRMRFNADDRVMETHTEYTNAVYETAQLYNAPLIDLDKRSRELLQQLGREDAKYLFMQMAPGEDPNYPEGITDNTHFNDFGARKMAELVLREIKALDLELAGRVLKK